MNVRLRTVFRTDAAVYARVSIAGARGVEPAAAVRGARVLADGERPLPCHVGGSPVAGEATLMFPLASARSYLLSFDAGDGAGSGLCELRLSASHIAWLSRVNWRARRGACEKAKQAVDAEAAQRSPVKFIQLLDFSEGEEVVRFTVREQGGDSAAGACRVLGPDGLALSRPPIELECISTAGSRMRVMSARVSRGAYPIVVDCGPDGFAVLDGAIAGALRRERDEAMVNPAIDERFGRLAAVADAQDDPRTIAARVESLPCKPLVSIVCPLYNTPPRFLADMVDSVLAQSYGGWELVLVNSTPGNADMREVLDGYDDARIREVPLDRNLGIVGNTNAGIAAATGDWIGFLDHDDMLAPNALLHYVEWMGAHPEDDVLYCDEDSFEHADGPRFAPLLKPDFNRDLLYTHNYIIHFLVARRALVEQVERSGADVEGVQDYDLILKAVERGARFGHVPRILYHWRQHEGSTNGGLVESKPESEAAGARAIAAHFARRAIRASVEVTDIPFVYRTAYLMEGALARTCVVIAARDGGAPERLAASLEPLCERGLQVVTAPADAALPWGARMNGALRRAEGRPYAVIVSDAVELDDPHAIEVLVGYLQRPEVGVAAAKLFYPDGLVQHAGLCAKRDGSLGFLNQNFAAHMGGGYHGFAECDCDYTATGPDFIALRLDAFDEAGGFGDYGDNALATVADFCFKMQDAGRVALVSPEARATVKAPVIWPGRPDDAPAPWSAGHPGMARLRDAWGVRLSADVLANPLVTFERSYPQLDAGLLDRAPAPRSSETATAEEGFMPKVSVIIPIYNAQPYLRQCLDSVRDQTLRDIEVLCVNDGSTDDSPDVIREFAAADPRFVVLDKPNGGYGHSLNHGLSHATGEFVAIVEPDDFIHPDMFEQLCRLADFGGVPADVVKGSYWEYYDGRDGFDGQIVKPPLAWQMSDTPFAFDVNEDHTVLQYHPSVWSALYRRSFLESEGIRFIEPKGAGWADNPFFLETLLAAKRIVWAPKGYYYYRQTNPNASSLLKDFHMPFERLRDLFEIAERRGASDAVKGTVYQRAFTYIESVIGDFGFPEADPELERLVDDTLAAMDPAIVYGFDEIELDEVAFYEARMSIVRARDAARPEGDGGPAVEAPADGCEGDAPIITFLVPMGNDALNAVKAIASITALPIDRFEALFVNCGSTDRTASLCAHAARSDHRFRMLGPAAEDGPGAALNAALDEARGAFLYVADLGCRFVGDFFARALLLAAEEGIDVVLLDDGGRHSVDAVCLTGGAQPRDSWGTGDDRALLTGPFDARAAARFALNCSDPSSRAGLYRTGLLRQAGVRFEDGDLACDRLFLARAILAAESAAYLGGPFQERIYEEPPWVRFYLDDRAWRIAERPPTLPRALEAARDAATQGELRLSALNLVLEAFAEDVSTRRSGRTLEEYVAERLPQVDEALESAPVGMWFHDGEAHADWQLLREEGVKGYCLYHYLICSSDADIRLERMEGLLASRTYKLGKSVKLLVKAVTPEKLVERLRSSQARNV